MAVVPVEVDEVWDAGECPVPGADNSLRIHQQQVLPTQVHTHHGMGVQVVERLDM